MEKQKSKHSLRGLSVNLKEAIKMVLRLSSVKTEDIKEGLSCEKDMEEVEKGK